MGRSEERVSKNGEGVGRKGISAPYFSHSLPVSFALRKFLKTPARQLGMHEELNKPRSEK